MIKKFILLAASLALAAGAAQAANDYISNDTNHPVPVTITSGGTGGGAATVADGADVTQGAKADAKSTATDTTAVSAISILKEISAMSQAPPSRAVTNAGTFAVQAAVADGADVSQGAKADAKNTATDTTPISAISILKEISAMVQAPPSQAVTNAGTFAVQANVSAINGVTPLMGNGASGTGAQRVTLANDSTGVVALTTGAAQIGHLEANQSSNVAQINGVTPLMGNGASGTGAQRVTLANDSTGIVALTTGAAQIGHLEANQSSNVAQINGVTPLMGAGNTGTGSPRVTIATDQAVIPVKELASTTTTGQVTASGSAATLVASNAARYKLTVRNQDASLSVYVGPATVSSVNGALLKAGESRVFKGATLLQVIAPSGSPVVDYVDETY